MNLIVNARFLTQQITGVQRYALEISKRLAELYSNIQFMSPKGIIDSALGEELKVSTDFCFKGHIWEQIELPFNIAVKNNPLLLCLGNTAPVFYRNKITTIHDISALNPEWVSKSFNRLYKILIPKIISTSRKLVTVSEFSKSEIIKHFGVPEANIDVIYNAVSDDFVKLASEAYKNPYGDYILAVSSINPRKNFKNLILAYNKLSPKDVKLVIVGSKSTIFKDSVLKNFVKDNKNIIFTGYVSDKELAGLYKNALIFIFPSLYEGFGIPSLEAMACGCPTIVSNTSSLPEVCEDASVYIDPYNINDISGAIEDLINNQEKRNKLIKNGYQRVKFFNWQRSAEQYAEIIKSMEVKE